MRRAAEDGNVLNYQDTNENLILYAGELGGLNEHNFDEEGFDVSQLDQGAVLRVTSTRITGTLNADGGLDTGACERLTRSAGWQTSADLTTSFEHPGGLAFVAISANLRLLNPGGYLFAVALNGYPILESCLGGLDEGNERISDDTGGTSTLKSVSCPGLYRQAYPIVVEAVLPVTPGTHTVSLAYRCYDGDVSVSDYLGQAELILILMVE